ncbi:SMP-30/gluconolactonase/LRE family protein [Prosthecomicrobium pneumaticum]|uniref:Sugar lactone lactonase YvrE n=1 Tax=Prosthecomicrobium pneumaticum TaxID=81895 RepID=A0A7W9CUH2_9HYPH|nr:SMP-30/gluconolactonase/LRE family protein [Prosthecomicrobium pneumaticum]MBB5751607.1 sugar lactone lactonase YvrE [Prosthecomicrobium pneumaticum]
MSGIEIGPVRCVVPAGDRCGEGALWSASEKAVYWTDINRFLVHRWRAADGAVHSWMFDEPVVALSLTDRADEMLVAVASRLLIWSPETDARRPQGFVLEGTPHVRLNDGRSDPSGRFWVGSMRSNVGPNGEVLDAGGTDGLLFRIGREGSSAVFRDGIGISNTLCWSPDRSRFYFADTLADIIWVHAYDDAAGTIGAPEVFLAGFGRGGPDGSTIDSDGYLWNCRFGGGCIVRIAPDGTVDRVIETPVTNPTTCAFGGDDLSTLFFTSAGMMAPESERLRGSLFAMETSVTGLPENRVTL